MERLDKAFDIFVRALDNAHIPSITVDGPYHSDTEELYQLAFDFYHMMKEARQNLGLDEAVEVCDVAQETYDMAEEMKEIIDEEIKSNKDTGYDNILRGFAEKAIAVCGKMRRYQRKAEKEEEYEEEVEKPAKTIKMDKSNLIKPKS